MSRRRKQRGLRKLDDPALWEIVHELLQARWSPQQIAGILAVDREVACDNVLTQEERRVLWLTSERKSLPAPHRLSVEPVGQPSWAGLRIPNAPGAPVGTPSGMDGHACSNAFSATGSPNR